MNYQPRLGAARKCSSELYS